MDGMDFAADADVHEVPEQTPLIIKSVTTVGLQLVKRVRNVLYAKATGRIAPSVMLSCHAGHAASPGMSLSTLVIRQARWTARAIDAAASRGRLLDVRNPEWHKDCFTDRWPENEAQQAEFARSLHDLADGLEAIKNGDVQLEDLQKWLRDYFGERVVSRSLKTFNERAGRAIRSSSVTRPLADCSCPPRPRSSAPPARSPPSRRGRIPIWVSVVERDRRHRPADCGDGGQMACLRGDPASRHKRDDDGRTRGGAVSTSLWAYCAGRGQGDQHGRDGGTFGPVEVDGGTTE
jgi:hypothetical protein